jgi:hypothetical protein
LTSSDTCLLTSHLVVLRIASPICKWIPSCQSIASCKDGMYVCIFSDINLASRPWKPRKAGIWRCGRNQRPNAQSFPRSGGSSPCAGLSEYPSFEVYHNFPDITLRKSSAILGRREVWWGGGGGGAPKKGGGLNCPTTILSLF